VSRTATRQDQQVGQLESTVQCSARTAAARPDVRGAEHQAPPRERPGRLALARPPAAAIRPQVGVDVVLRLHMQQQPDRCSGLGSDGPLTDLVSSDLTSGSVVRSLVAATQSGVTVPRLAPPTPAPNPMLMYLAPSHLWSRSAFNGLDVTRSGNSGSGPEGLVASVRKPRKEIDEYDHQGASDKKQQDLGGAQPIAALWWLTIGLAGGSAMEEHHCSVGGGYHESSYQAVNGVAFEHVKAKPGSDHEDDGHQVTKESIRHELMSPEPATRHCDHGGSTP
jgi:hypothetical protein